MPRPHALAPKPQAANRGALDVSDIISSDGDEQNPTELEVTPAEFAALMEDSDRSQNDIPSVDILPAPPCPIKMEGARPSSSFETSIGGEASASKASPGPVVAECASAKLVEPATEPAAECSILPGWQMGSKDEVNPQKAAPPLLSPQKAPAKPRVAESELHGFGLYSSLETDPTRVLAFAGCLDTLAKDFKNSAMQQFQVSTKQLTEKHQAALEAQQAHWSTVAKDQQAQIEALKASERELMCKNVSYQRKLKKLGEFALRTRCSDVAKTVRRWGAVGRCALAAIMASWKTAIQIAKGARVKESLSRKHGRRKLLGYVYSLWRRRAHQAALDREEAHQRTASELARSKLIGEASLERERLVLEVESLKRRLAEESRHRTQLQENLKRVFMRGVCALNFEAMTLLSPPGVEGMIPAQENVEPNSAGFDWKEFDAERALTSALLDPNERADRFDPAQRASDLSWAAEKTQAHADSERVEAPSPLAPIPMISSDVPIPESARSVPGESQAGNSPEQPRSPPQPTEAPAIAGKPTAHGFVQSSSLPFVNYYGHQDPPRIPGSPVPLDNRRQARGAPAAKASPLNKERRWQSASTSASRS